MSSARAIAAVAAVVAIPVIVSIAAVTAGSAASGCYDFTYREPSEGGSPTGDAATAGCVTDVSYCGGDQVIGASDTVYRCTADGGGLLLRKCASGCTQDEVEGPIDPAARCRPPASPCSVGGSYCGGDRLDGDPRILYRCVAGGAGTLLERCANGCRVMPAGTDDACVR